MSLDELSRKWEKGGASAQADHEVKMLAKEFFSIVGIDSKTRIPDADAFSDIDVLIMYIEKSFGEKAATMVKHRLARFKINVLSQTKDYIPSRDEVRDILKAEKQQKQESGRSILDRLQSGDY